MTAVLTRPTVQPTSGSAANGDVREQRIVLTGIRWQTYKDLLEDLGDRPVRLTYNGGRLEIMTLSNIHETYKTLLGRMFELLTLLLHIPIRSLGSSTLNPETVQKGLEADECYYVLNEPKVRGKKTIDLTVDPPPDLAIEVDITSSSLNRLEIYAALRIAEIWRFDGKVLQILLLQADGSYAEGDKSLNLPFFPVKEIVQFLQPNQDLDETSTMWSFIAWLREKKLIGDGAPAIS